MPLVELKDLEKSYTVGTEQTFVLRRINLAVDEGEFVTIMGPSGAGKSTVLGILGMLDGEFEGEYFLEGNPVHRLKRRARLDLSKRYVGFVFQSYHLLDDLTVQENLAMPLSYRAIGARERASRVDEILERFNLAAKKKLFPNQLSGGQQQLVAVARAVITQPQMILADEPTGNLHTAQGQEIMELFAELNRDGTTIIQVTHSEKNAAFGDRVIQLKDGWIESDAGAGTVQKTRSSAAESLIVS